MKATEVPASLLAVECLRCHDTLAVDPNLSPADRHQLTVEHHLYLCTNPTPNVGIWRSLGFPEPRPDQRP